MKKILIIFTAILMMSSCASNSNTTEMQIVGGNKVNTTSSNTNDAQIDISSLSNSKKCWGQGYNVNEKNQPISSIEYNNLYGKYDAYFIGEKEKSIYLTFDEGYENGYTSQILDVLKDKKVSAVFFVTYDYVKGNNDLIKRMINEGHIIGNHSWSHPSMPDVSDEECKLEISKLHEYMLENYNYEMVYIRPPRGEFSERTLAITKNLGYKTVLWSFAYKDYDVNNQPDNTKAFTRITDAVHDGAIYLLHAVSKTNTDILGDVIDEWRSKGYTISKLDI